MTTLPAGRNSGAVAELWRYPVMGFGGESLREAFVSSRGIVGDHVYALRNKEGNKIIGPKNYEYSWGRTVHALGMLDLGAAFRGGPGDGASMEISIPDGTKHSASGAKTNQALSGALGQSVELIEYPRIVDSRMRAGRTLHLLTYASLAAMKGAYPEGDFDLRRFRANIIVKTPHGTMGFIEEEWCGDRVAIGDEVVLRIEEPNMRCQVTTMKQGGLPNDPMILRAIEDRNEGKLGVMCSVERGGLIRVGDDLNVLP